jgi:tRNA-specific 2-thiouridylase
MEKSDTRRLARSLGLRVADKPATQDLCFMGDRDYREFLGLRRSEAFKEGPIVCPDGRIIGRHNGIARYTVGQRKGLGIPTEQPLYVVRIDAERNTLVAGTEKQLQSQALWVRDVNWIAFDSPPPRLGAGVKIRYGQTEQPATIRPSRNGAKVVLDRPQRAIAPGQSAVFYHDDIVLGGGIIEQ